MEQIFLEEIKGKNLAIHAYDRIIWTVRSGYVTIFFAAWGILLTGLAAENVSFDQIRNLIPPIWIVSVGLSLCAWIVDMNYVRRKFRVITALNNGYSEVVQHLTSEPDADLSKLNADELERFLHVSGDSGNKSFKGKGYRDAWIVGASIYVVACTSIIIALVIVWAGSDSFSSNDHEAKTNYGSGSEFSGIAGSLVYR